jgi:hypothetical protein
MSQQINFDVPSPATLAGIYICVEGEEDVTVRPHQIQPIHIAEAENGASDRDRLAKKTTEAKP